MKAAEAWNEFFYLTQTNYPDQQELIQARITNLIITISTSCFFIYGFIYLAMGNYYLSVYINFPAGIVESFCLLYRRQSKAYRSRGWFAIYITAIGVVGICHFTGNYYSPSIVWCYAIIIAGALGLGGNAAFKLVVLLCLAVLTNVALTETQLIPNSPKNFQPFDKTFEIFIFITQISGFIVVGFSINAFQSMLHRAYQTARDAKQAVEEQKKQLDQQNLLLEKQQLLLVEKKAQLEMSHEALKHVDQQKTHFFQNISHELRTPLTLILSSVRKMDASVPATGVLQRNTERLYRLVNQLLDYQKLAVGSQSIHTNPLQIVRVVDSVAQTFAPACEEKKISFHYQRPDKHQNNEVLIQAQIDALEKILYNFLSNALKFTPSGGSIHLVCRLVGDEVRIEVVDSGPGIAPEDQQKLFKIFSQVEGTSSREYEGTGLGLALAKELTEKMGGVVGVKSQKGKGSQFWVSFPICTTPVPIDILYVGAEDFGQEISLSVPDVVRQDWVVQAAGSEQEACQLLRNRKVHVLIVDTNLAEGDSSSVLAYAWQHQAQCRRIVITNKIMRHNKVQTALTEGRIERVLSHPLTADGLHTLDCMIRESRVNEHQEIIDILIVDDEVSQLRRLEQILDQIEDVKSVRKAQRYADALKIINNCRLKCIVADAGLMSDSGIQLLKEAARIQPNCARILITGDERPEIFDEAIREKTVHRIIYKPIEQKDFCDHIQIILNDYQSKHLSQPIAGKSKEWLFSDARQSHDTAKASVVDHKNQPNIGTLLVADDVDDLRHMICDVLEQAGYKTIPAHDGRMALQKIREFQPDLVITDWMMPGLTGPELIHELQKDENLKGLPTILLSAKGDISRAEGTQSGGSAYLSKPFDEAELLSTVYNLLRLKESERKIAQLNQHITQNILSRSFPPELVASIQSGDFSFEQEPKLETVTILFVDLCDFSRASIDLGPRRVASMINQFFQVMTDVVFEAGGMVDKFLGDGILCIFGAPRLTQAQVQVEQAINCTQKMLEHLKQLNDFWYEQVGIRFDMRAGIHHGPVVIGMFGGSHRQEYTVIGPSVNLASRIQTVAQPGEIWFSETVRDYLTQQAWESVGAHELKGVGKVKLYRTSSVLSKAS